MPTFRHEILAHQFADCFSRIQNRLSNVYNAPDLVYLYIAGYHTGSIYRDWVMKTRFPVVKVDNARRLLAVKTHFFGTNYDRRGDPCNDQYERVIFLMRNPFDAVLAEFHRQHSNHTEHAAAAAYNGIVSPAHPPPLVDSAAPQSLQRISCEVYETGNQRV